jgi:maspardin
MTDLTLERFRQSATTRALQAGGHDWAFWQLGAGRMPVVFLPGVQGTGEVLFKPALALSGTNRTITVTYPAIFDGTEFTKAFADFLDTLGLDRIILAGSSLGGYFAQRFAASHPDRLTGLVIGNSFVDATSVQADRYDPQKLLGTDAGALKSTMIERLAAGPDSELKSVLLDVMGEKQPAETLKARALGVAHATPIAEPAFDIARTLVIDSDPDPVLGALLRDQVPVVYAGAHYLRIPGGTHYPYIAAWDRYGPALGNFVAKVGG